LHDCVFAREKEERLRFQDPRVKLPKRRGKVSEENPVIYREKTEKETSYALLGLK